MDIQAFNKALDNLATQRSVVILPIIDQPINSNEVTQDTFKEFIKSNAGKKLIEKEVQAQMSLLPLIDNFDPKGEGWRISGITQLQRQDLVGIDQANMFKVAYFMYATSPLFKRLLHLDQEFLFGEDFKVECDDQVVLDVLNQFSERNKLNTNFKLFMLWFSALGEQCYPVDINDQNGFVTIKYIDPAIINNVLVDHTNVLNWKEVELAIKENNQNIKYKIISEDNDIQSETYGKLTGDCFYFSLNHSPNNPRGISDYYNLFDLIDGLERACMQHLERIELMKNFIWDVTIENATNEYIEKWLRSTSKPRPNTIRAHNEKVKWNAVSPDIQASDFSASFETIVGFIMGLCGRPRNWLGQGGKVYSQEADQQDQVPQKSFDNRQKIHYEILKSMFDFVIDQAIIHGKIINKDRSKIKYKIVMPEVSKKNFIRGVVTLPQAVTALKLAVDDELIDKNNAMKIFVYTINQLGYQLDSIEVKKAIDQANNELKAQGKDLGSMFDYSKIPDLNSVNTNEKEITILGQKAPE